MKFDKIQELIDEATPGPWFVDTRYAGVSVRRYTEDELGKKLIFRSMINKPTGDHHFIAASRELMPKLLAVAQLAHTVAFQVFRGSIADMSDDFDFHSVQGLRQAIVALVEDT